MSDDFIKISAWSWHHSIKQVQLFCCLLNKLQSHKCPKDLTLWQSCDNSPGGLALPSVLPFRRTMKISYVKQSIFGDGKLHLCNEMAPPVLGLAGALRWWGPRWGFGLWVGWLIWPALETESGLPSPLVRLPLITNALAAQGEGEMEQMTPEQASLLQAKKQDRPDCFELAAPFICTEHCH